MKAVSNTLISHVLHSSCVAQELLNTWSFSTCQFQRMMVELTVPFLFIIQEIPKTPDFAPSRTFYLYTCNQLPIARMLLQNCYKVKRTPPAELWLTEACICLIFPLLTSAL